MAATAERVPVVPPAARRLAAEFLGSALLVAVVVGSGIAAQTLSPADTGLALLENALATAGGLLALILMFGPVSGAHFNPVVSAVDAALGGMPWREVAAYLPAQVLGAICGAILANLMYAGRAVSISTHSRATGAHLLAEVVATAGLVLLIFSLVRSGRSALAAPAVGAYIGAAYWFTSSTSFANPAVTIGRMFSDTFAGIKPSSAPAFILAQLVGAGLGLLLVRILYPGPIAETATAPVAMDSPVAVSATETATPAAPPAAATEPAVVAEREPESEPAGASAGRATAPAR